MKIEEIYTILSAFFLGQLSAVVDAFWWSEHPYMEYINPYHFNMLNFFSLVFWGFAIYFTLKYSGIIKKGKKKCKKK